MDADAIKSSILRAAGIILGWAAGRYHLDPSQVGAIMSDVSYVGAAVAFGIGLFNHWGMKKVPEKSIALELPKGVDVPPVGASLPLTPLTGMAKVVG